jgi:heptosyltransferase-2
MSIPALRELRRIFPDAKITLHTRSWADGLFDDAAFIDELVTFEKNRFVVKDVYDNSRFLKGDAYDLAVILPNSFESAITSFLSKIPRRIGYNKDLRGLLLTDPVAVPEWKNRRHEVFYYLNLIAETERRVLGTSAAEHVPPDCRLDIAVERKMAARKRLAEAGVTPNAHTVAFVAGSANEPVKRWPAENFARLANHLRSEASANIIMLGSKDEAEVSERVMRSADVDLVDLTGQTSLGDAAAILSTVDLTVSNDTGLAHVAPAVGSATAVIFGPTDPDTTRPFSPLARVLQGRSAEWPSVDDVFETCLEMLQDDVNDEPTSYIS